MPKDTNMSADDDHEDLAVYDEIEIEDMDYDSELQSYYYPCPCGDKFMVTLQLLYEDYDIATCPSCSLRIRVIFDTEQLPKLESVISGQTEPQQVAIEA